MPATNSSVSTHRAIKVMALLLLWTFPLPGLAASVAETGFAPFIESHANGWIDWDNGLIYGIGRGYLSKNRNNRSISQRVATVLASGNIVKLASGIHLDDAKTLETIDSGHVSIHLEALLQDKEHKSTFVDDPTDPYFEVVRVASMKGVGGLTAKLLDHLTTVPTWRDFPVRPLSPQAKLNDDDQPWLVLDARGLANNDRLKPAMFPKIISETGETLYELKTAEEAALLKRGMMRYVVSAEPAATLRSNHRAMDRLLAGAGLLFGGGEAQAETEGASLQDPVFPPASMDTQKTPRKKRERYIVKDVQGVQGLAKTNLVVSAQDAKNLKIEDLSSKILQRCRVVVIVSSPIGGIEGNLPTLLAMNSGAR